MDNTNHAQTARNLKKENIMSADKKAAQPAKAAEVQKPVVAAMGFNPANIKKVGDIVIPTMSIKSLKEGDTMYIRVESEIAYVVQTNDDGEIKMEKDGKTPAKLPIIIATNLVSGMRGQMVLPSIVHRGMEAAGALKDRCFMLTKGASLGTGKANLWEVSEFQA